MEFDRKVAIGNLERYSTSANIIISAPTAATTITMVLEEVGELAATVAAVLGVFGAEDGNRVGGETMRITQSVGV